MKKICFGSIHADYISMNDAIDSIVELARSGAGGFVVTPNVDHVMLAKKDSALRAAYADASLSLVDGMPLKWISALVGEPLPEKISGSDLIRPMLRRAAREGLRVYFLGSAPGVGQAAADRLRSEIVDLNIVGVDSPPMGFEKDHRLEDAAMRAMLESRPDIVLMALGCPKQELLMHKWSGQTSGIVYLGIGAGLDFIAGKIKRSPAWMSRAGLEWVYRLSRDPGRLARRYLLRDSAVLSVFWRMYRSPRGEIIVNE